MNACPCSVLLGYTYCQSFPACVRGDSTDERGGGRLDVSLPLNGSIDRSVPAWTTNLLDEYTSTIDAFSKVSLLPLKHAPVEEVGTS